MRNKIIELISYHGGIKPDRIYDDSKLEKDLGVTGDDLWELLEDMDKEFKIDWKEIDSSYFFYPECAGFIWRAMNKEKVKSIQAHPITVNHLVLVAQKGEWFAPESQNLKSSCIGLVNLSLFCQKAGVSIEISHNKAIM